ncbi:hypothetical protein RB195_004566 [Necator americanus]|uniref:Tropomyosin n=1 Tax=Necator americanus TaxID=51031 RepID=A0ABR1BM27_NECAM
MRRECDRRGAYRQSVGGAKGRERDRLSLAAPAALPSPLAESVRRFRLVVCGCTPRFTTTTIKMDAIKKKMQAMKIEKDNALDRADAAEEKVRQITEKLERVEEELRDTQKKMMQTENDLDKAQEDLAAATSQLEDKDKKVQEVYNDC